MRARQEEILEQQARVLDDLRFQAIAMAREADNGLSEESKNTLRTLSTWLLERSKRLQTLSKNKSKVSITRFRLLSLQIEKILDGLGSGPNLATSQDNLSTKLNEILENQQKRDLYDDMVSCLRELSTLSVERGLGREAAVYNDISQRLEARLESGHIDVNDKSQRAKDEALYANFQQELDSLKR